MGSVMQGVCERNMLSALKKFNNNINDGNKLTLKPKLNELHKQLTPAGNNADEEFKKSYNSIKDLIGACAEKCPGKFNISSDQDPLSKIYQEIMGKKYLLNL